MATEHNFEIATAIHYYKFQGAKAAVWTRDHAYPITSTSTSMMPTTTPYDRATPPFPAHMNKPLPPIPHPTYQQTSNNNPTSLFAGCSHAPSPRPAPAPREQEQDDLYYAFTQDTSLYSSTPASQDIARKLNLYCPRPQKQYQPQRTLPLPTIPIGRRPRTEAERKVFPNTMATQVSSHQLPPLLPLKKPSTWASSPFTFDKPGRKKRRPSEIFNLTFSFTLPSRRSNTSPDISPRSSLSSASASPPPSLLKRARKDSAGEAHPGQLVTFEKEEEKDEYHEFLAGSTMQRRASYPPDTPALYHLPPLSPFFPLSTGLKRACTHPPEKRQCPPTALPVASTPVLATTTRMEGLGGEETGTCMLQRSTSDPSTEAFLAHIRASRSAREKAKTEKQGCGVYTVFSDEVEKGFLDEKPL
jgi:hypothetical protein